MKNILMITTGGTISMKLDRQKGGAVPSLKGDDLIRALPPIANLANLDVYEFANIPSPYMTPDLMMELAQFIDKKCAQDYDGVIVTHGTDTLEETAFFLETILHTNKPVILTAAMRNIDELSGDGPRNIWGALNASVCKSYSDDIGVTIVLNDEIHTARDVTKTYTSNVATFRSPLFGPVGLVDNDKVTFFFKPYNRIKIYTTSVENRIAMLKAYSGMDADVIDALIALKYKGIVIEAFGRGNLPNWLVAPIKRAIDAGITVVISSRCYMGRVLGDYAYDGGGKTLEDIGALFAYDLRGIKARILLMLAQGKYGNDTEKIKQIFTFLE